MIGLFHFALAGAVLLASAGAAAAEPRWQTLPEPGPMPKPAHSGYAPVDGIRMYYAVFGNGTPVLLIHGGLSNADVWASQVDALSRTHTVIVADSRGHGRSTRTDTPLSYHLMATDYLALLDYLKIDKVALVGWSDGGIIGFDIALNHPERLTRLFAQGANVTTDGIETGAVASKVFAAYIERARRDYKALSPTPDQYDAFVGGLARMWQREPNWTRDDLARIKTPTAIVAGDHDEAVKREHTDYMASVIPGAREIILPEASHFAMLQAPDDYSKAVLEFIDAK